jgi:hypothetical protein
MNDYVLNIAQRKTLAQKSAEDIIRKAENDINYYTARKEAFDPPLLELEETGYPIDVRLTSVSVDIRFSGPRKMLNDVFGILRKYGFKPDKRPKEGETSYSGFFHDEVGRAFYLSFSSTSCRRVQVGTKTVEQPIYETVCDDE